VELKLKGNQKTFAKKRRETANSNPGGQEKHPFIVPIKKYVRTVFSREKIIKEKVQPENRCLTRNRSQFTNLWVKEKPCPLFHSVPDTSRNGVHPGKKKVEDSYLKKTKKASFGRCHPLLRRKTEGLCGEGSQTFCKRTKKNRPVLCAKRSPRNRLTDPRRKREPRPAYPPSSRKKKKRTFLKRKKTRFTSVVDERSGEHVDY